MCVCVCVLCVCVCVCERERERERETERERQRQRDSINGTRSLISSDRLKYALSTPNAALCDLLLTLLQKIEKMLALQFGQF